MGVLHEKAVQGWSHCKSMPLFTWDFEMSVRKENRWRKRLHEDARELYDRKLELESAFMQRNDSKPKARIAHCATRLQVRRWMIENSCDFVEMTSLVEAANAALALPDSSLDDETHWVWDEAFRALK